LILLASKIYGSFGASTSEAGFQSCQRVKLKFQSSMSFSRTSSVGASLMIATFRSFNSFSNRTRCRTSVLRQ